MNQKYILAAFLCGALTLTSCLDDKESETVTNLRDKQNQLEISKANLSKAQAEADLATANANAALVAAKANIETANAAKQAAYTALEKINAEKAEIERQRQETQNEKEKLALDIQLQQLEVDKINQERIAVENEKLLAEQKAQLDIEAQNLAMANLEADRLMALEQQKLEEAKINETQKLYAAQNSIYQNQLKQLQTYKSELFDLNSSLVEAEGDLVDFEYAKQLSIEKNNVQIELNNIKIAEYKKYEKYDENMLDLIKEQREKEYAAGITSNWNIEAIGKALEKEQKDIIPIQDELGLCKSLDVFPAVMETDVWKATYSSSSYYRQYIQKAYVWVDADGDSIKTGDWYQNFAVYNGYASTYVIEAPSKYVKYTPEGSDVEKTFGYRGYRYVKVYREPKLTVDFREITVAYNDKKAEREEYLASCQKNSKAWKKAYEEALKDVEATKAAYEAADRNHNEAEQQAWLKAIDEARTAKDNYNRYLKWSAGVATEIEVLEESYGWLNNWDEKVEELHAAFKLYDDLSEEVAANLIDLWKAYQDALFAANKIWAEYAVVDEKLCGFMGGSGNVYYEGAYQIEEGIEKLEQENRELEQDNKDLSEITDQQGLIANIKAKIALKEEQIASQQKMVEACKVALDQILETEEEEEEEVPAE